MKPTSLMTSKDPIRLPGLQQFRDNAAGKRISEDDAMVLAGIYFSDASNFVPGQRIR